MKEQYRLVNQKKEIDYKEFDKFTNDVIDKYNKGEKLYLSLYDKISPKNMTHIFLNNQEFLFEQYVICIFLIDLFKSYIDSVEENYICSNNSIKDSNTGSIRNLLKSIHYAGYMWKRINITVHDQERIKKWLIEEKKYINKQMEKKLEEHNIAINKKNYKNIMQIENFFNKNFRTNKKSTIEKIKYLIRRNYNFIKKLTIK